MNCKYCGSDNIQIVSNTSGNIERRGCISILFHLIMICITGGIWILYLIISNGSKGKITTQNYGICRDCGRKFKI